ncbi:MAG: ABC-ATPase UvrA [Desulfuromonas sp. SDB]|nr:MAG: ABC-ATPase UvrA [Desulfuromonas sp. SDB]
MKEKFIVIRKAKVHNLKSINLDIPRNKLVVITGISGSGKSSLAFDTIYAEGQRRYVESLSSYARQFLGIMEKPDAERIDGLSPAISIAQRKIARNPRSTVGTITEIYDYLRLLYARVATPHCPQCKKPIKAYTQKEIIDEIFKMPFAQKIMILAPMVINKQGSFQRLFNKLRRKGYIRVLIDNELFFLEEISSLKKTAKHDIFVVVDRLITGEELSRQRVSESIETALKESDYMVAVRDVDAQTNNFYALNPICPQCHLSLPSPDHRLFSFNSPEGACSECGGLGTKVEILPELLAPDQDISLLDGAIIPWGTLQGKIVLTKMKQLSNKFNFKLSQPFHSIPPQAQQIIFWGEPGFFEGLIPNLERRYKQTESNWIRREIEKYMSFSPCPCCQGKRLSEEALSYKINNQSIAALSSLPVNELQKFFLDQIKLSSFNEKIAKPILREIKNRIRFMVEVGLDYISLDRKVETLSGGEDQRVHLATQIGSGLVGVTYVLDEPSIGLHPRDTGRLLKTLIELRDMENNVIVVEHDRQIIETADHIIDLGPGAGRTGGKVVAEGPVEQVKKASTPTGMFLSRKQRIHIPPQRRTGNNKYLEVIGAQQNNLKTIDVKFPLNTFICITGVSGSGKSSLLEEVVYKALKKHFSPLTNIMPGKHKHIKGLSHLDRVININQSPIGRTSRSNPATYTGIFTSIRELFANLPESKARGYKVGRFSFNVKGGRCEKCEGQGNIKIEMHFLPDIYITCDQCNGQRFNQETLEIYFKNKNIAEILEMTVTEAEKFFSPFKDITKKLNLLTSVGLGYLHLGQPAPHLSGGEAQRLKLTRELSKGGSGNTLYILDEPTTGLHFADIKILLKVLNQLVDRGDSLIIVEHNMDIIKCADYIIDLGPEGGDKGGMVVATGSPEEVSRNNKSITGRYLRDELGLN